MNFLPEELNDSGLLARVLAAQDTASELIDKSYESPLAPLDIKRDELSQFIIRADQGGINGTDRNTAFSKFGVSIDVRRRQISAFSGNWEQDREQSREQNTREQGRTRAYQHQRKSLKGKDGLKLYSAVAPRVAGSNPVAHPKFSTTYLNCIP